MRKPWSPQLLARWIGILLLISVVAGGFGESYVPLKLIVPGDAAGTANNIFQSQALFRLGFASYVVEGLCDAALTAFLYLLLRPAGRELAAISCSTCAIFTAAGRSISPRSGASSPKIAANRLDFPVPLAPVMPTLSPR